MILMTANNIQDKFCFKYTPPKRETQWKVTSNQSTTMSKTGSLKGSQLGQYFLKQNTFKYNKKLFSWQRNPSWSSQLRRDKFVAPILGLGLGKISGQALKFAIRLLSKRYKMAMSSMTASLSDWIISSFSFISIILSIVSFTSKFKSRQAEKKACDLFGCSPLI